jgi:4-hydroxy-3-polyprenylbenzoate decarboxylase
VSGRVPPAKLVVGVTGASGAPYARRLLDVLAPHAAGGALELAVCASENAGEVWALECGGELRAQVVGRVWEGRDFLAPFASGSAGWDAMVVVPCSMCTLAKIAHGIADSVLLRAADVMLKERRPLVLVPRETPLSLVHLENMAQATRAGATILPAMPSFYGAPRTVQDLVDTVVARTLDHLGIAHQLSRPWGASP